MTIFPNYAQLPPYRPSGADDSEVILHPPSATEPDCIRPSVYQIASGSNEILCCVGQGLPSIEPARKIGNVAKPGAPQDTGRDRAAVAALAMDDEQFAAIQLRDSIRQLSQGNPDGILHSAGLDFTGLADIPVSQRGPFLFPAGPRIPAPRFAECNPAHSRWQSNRQCRLGGTPVRFQCQRAPAASAIPADGQRLLRRG